jgi:hypothetical protein
MTSDIRIHLHHNFKGIRAAECLVMVLPMLIVREDELMQSVCAVTSCYTVTVAILIT